MIREIEAELNARLETGALKVNDDWAGTFIRGDRSLYYAIQIDLMLKDPTHPDTRCQMMNLRDLLRKCNENTAL